MNTAHIRTLTTPDELFRHYDGQHQPQPCHLNIDLNDGEIFCDYDPNIGSGVSADIWHRRILAVDIPCLTADAANKLMAEILPLAQRVLDGSSIDWNGNNHVGTLDADAGKAWMDIVEACEEDQFDSSDTIGYWAVSDWFTGADETRAALNITANTIDEKLAELAAAEVELAKTETECGYGVLDLTDTLAYLTQLRNDLRDE